MEQPDEAGHDAGASTSTYGVEVGTIDHEDMIIGKRSEIEEDVEMEVPGSTGTGIQEEDEIVVIDDGFNGFPPVTETPTKGDGEDVYVAVGKSDSSLDALSWALKNAVKPGSFVYLVHVFPEVHQIPTLLGNMPKHSASKEQVDSYMNQERIKRTQMLQKYLNICRSSRVQHDVHLIESDYTESAILELIPVLHIKILVIGTSKANLRRLKRGGTKAGIIQKKAPEYCEVKIICEGKDVSTITSLPDPTPPASPLISELIKSERRELELTPKSPLSPEVHSISTSDSMYSRKENKFKKLFRFLSCNSHIPRID